MNKANILKNGIIGTAVIALFTMPTSNKVLATPNCIPVEEENIKYVNATITDINPQEYNTMVRGISKEQYYSLPIEEKAKYDNKSILFGSTEELMVAGLQNRYIATGVSGTCFGVQQGLVKTKLNNGEVVTNYNNGNTLFPQNGPTGSGTAYQEILSNWKFPFVKQENGYYSFDCNNYHVSRDYANKKFDLHRRASDGFFPFNNCGDDTSLNSKQKNTYFTAQFEIPFVMTSDGKVKNSTSGNYEDMVFNFSGDDDVWIYIDDTLVLDLGGGHIKQTGNINFAKNQVYYSSVYDELSNSDKLNVVRSAFQNGMLSQGNHTMRIFYMERAGGESNLFASFNLQSSGIETKYMEKYTGKEIESTIKTGAVGEVIDLEEKEFEDKVLVEKPDVTSATLKTEPQTYYYWYKNKYAVTAEYIDIADGSKIAEDEIAKITEDDNYETSSKEISDYKLIEIPKNYKGQMPHENVKVTYYYKFTNTKAKINYIDKLTGNYLDSKELTGIEGEEIPLEDKEFEGFVLDEKPNTEKFSKKKTELNYYYKHKGKITINQVDKVTNKILDSEVKNGIEGDKITHGAKEFENYIWFSGPEENTSTLTREDQTVNYYFIHQSKAIVNYIDKDTGKNLDKIEDTVTEGTIYPTEEKQFEEYKIIEKPETNSFLIGKDNIEVNYYYQKLKLNLKVEMNMEKVIINDKYHELKGKIGKVETEIKEANGSSTSKIFYKIKVTNDEEKLANGVLSNYIPDGYQALQEDNQMWKITGNTATINVEKINPGESREYELVITKFDGVDIVGTIKNKVAITSTESGETRLDDNEDSADLVIMPRTGAKSIILGVMCVCMSMFIAFIRLRKR